MTELGIPACADGRTGDKSLSKVVNRALLLDLLRKGGSASRASLAKASGLTKVTVSSQVAELIGLGIVRETGAGPSELGRKPVMLEIDASAGYALGVSITTESLHTVATDATGRILRDERLPLSDPSPDRVAEAIVASVKAARKRYARSRYGLFGVGIAVPGAVERQTGRVVRSAKLDWTDVELKRAVGKRYDGILHVGNDATLATIAEREMHAPDADDFVCLLIDEGIGSGAYINGAIHYGHNGQFGEVGHMTIKHGGPRCPCGNFGCWDLYGSELALRQAIGTARPIDAARPSDASRPADAAGVPDLDETLALAADPPAWCRPAFVDFVDYVTTGVVSIVNSMAPTTMSINCAVLAAAPALFEAIKAGVADRAMAHVSACELRISSLGKSAPAAGACMAVSQRFFEALVLQGSE